MKKYFYSLVYNYLSVYLLPHDRVLEIVNDDRVDLFNVSQNWSRINLNKFDGGDDFDRLYSEGPYDFILLNGCIHFERDIQELLHKVRQLCTPRTRLLTLYYSNLWRPFVTFANFIGLRRKHPEENWLTHEDIRNILSLENFDLLKIEPKVILPLYIPILSNFVNRYLSPLPFFRIFCLFNIALARPIINDESLQNASVSVVIPARNEAGNIENIVLRLPKMGPNDEIIFVEGGSSDDTWDRIEYVAKAYGSTHTIRVARQKGKGKGDAVRLGFSMAANEILMILDADITVPPEDLPKFYNAIKNGKGEFINGTRLVYPMEKKAMRFMNMLGNKFFAFSFSYVLGQKFRDTLCGTKVLTRINYEKLSKNREFFGDFDPFGDFDLIFGAARMGLGIIEVPVSYRERVYGTTNISRWRHGAILLAMLLFAARKIKFT